MNKLLNYLAIAVILFIAITGGLLSTDEYIPDNAKILVIEEYKIWIPDADWANRIFKEQASEDLNAKNAYSHKIEATYVQTKSGKFEGFDLPESWKEGEGKAKIVWGRDQSLLRSWFYPKKKRWNSDGSWNW